MVENTLMVYLSVGNSLSIQSISNMDIYDKTVASLLEYVASPVASFELYFVSSFNSIVKDNSLSIIMVLTLLCKVGGSLRYLMFNF